MIQTNSTTTKICACDPMKVFLMANVLQAPSTNILNLPCATYWYIIIVSFSNYVGVFQEIDRYIYFIIVHVLLMQFDYRCIY